jgi:hypothetical protein
MLIASRSSTVPILSRHFVRKFSLRRLSRQVPFVADDRSSFSFLTDPFFFIHLETSWWKLRHPEILALIVHVLLNN